MGLSKVISICLPIAIFVAFNHTIFSFTSPGEKLAYSFLLFLGILTFTTIKR